MPLAAEVSESTFNLYVGALAVSGLLLAVLAITGFGASSIGERLLNALFALGFLRLRLLPLFHFRGRPIPDVLLRLRGSGVAGPEGHPGMAEAARRARTSGRRTSGRLMAGLAEPEPGQADSGRFRPIRPIQLPPGQVPATLSSSDAPTSTERA